MSPKIYTLEEIRRIVSPVAVKHGVARVYLFGSYARGEATPGSDLDFRIDKGSIRSLFALGGFYGDLEEAIQKPLDVVTTESLNAEFLREIGREEVLVYAKQ